jgi:hypothetical protein
VSAVSYNDDQRYGVKALVSVDIFTPAYATDLGKVAKFPVPSAYTLASIKISFSTWKDELQINHHRNLMNFVFNEESFHKLYRGGY